MDKKDSNGNGKNWFLQYWHIMVFVICTTTSIIVGYSTLQNKVLGNEALAKTTSDTVNRHEVAISEQGIQLQNIKETLCKIEHQNDKLDNKIDKVLDIVINKSGK